MQFVNLGIVFLEGGGWDVNFQYIQLVVYIDFRFGFFRFFYFIVSSSFFQFIFFQYERFGEFFLFSIFFFENCEVYGVRGTGSFEIFSFCVSFKNFQVVFLQRSSFVFVYVQVCMVFYLNRNIVQIAQVFRGNCFGEGQRQKRSEGMYIQSGVVVLIEFYL